MDLKSIKRSKCGKCASRAYPGQPLEKCYECKSKFCPDDFWRGLYCPERMTENDELRVICDKCKEEFDYREL